MTTQCQACPCRSCSTRRRRLREAFFDRFFRPHSPKLPQCGRAASAWTAAAARPAAVSPTGSDAKIIVFVRSVFLWAGYGCSCRHSFRRVHDTILDIIIHILILHEIHTEFTNLLHIFGSFSRGGSSSGLFEGVLSVKNPQVYFFVLILLIVK